VLTKLGYQDDERISDAMHLMLAKKNPDGKWLLEGDWARERKKDKNSSALLPELGDPLQRLPRKALVPIEQLMEPSRWITLNCYRVLAKTGDLELPS